MKICKDCEHCEIKKYKSGAVEHYCCVYVTLHVDRITGDTWYDGKAFCSYRRDNDCGQEGKLFKKKHWWRFWK